MAELNSTAVVNTTVFTLHLLREEDTEVGIVSKNARDIFEVVNYVTISAAIGLLGICTNTINIVIFVKLGFKDVINISLLALTIADLVGLVILEWFNFCINPYLRDMNLPFIPSEILYVTGGWPHSCFMKITCLVTAFISFERCLCIALPLKVNTLLTPRRTLIALTFIFIFVFVSVIPAYMTVQFQWRFDEEQNRNVLGIFIDEKKTHIKNIAFIVNTIMQFTAFGSVIVTTFILVKKLKQKAEWRNKTATFGGKGQDASTVSSKDKALMRMVILMSVILILCCTPGTTFYIVSLFEKEFSVKGDFQNLYFTAWSFAYITDAINPAVSIFIYLAMSSKYKRVFYSTFKPFKRCVKQKENPEDSTYASSTTKETT